MQIKNPAMSLRDLLSNLTESLSSASRSLPEAESSVPPLDGISLLDTKNELLLSYIQNLVFLIILKLRNQKNGVENISTSQTSDEEVVKNLVSLRVYLERGVRPLESRLKYQIDKLLLAANDAESQAAPKTNGSSNKTTKQTGKPKNSLSSSSSRSPTPQPQTASRVSDLSYRPNPSAFIRPAARAPSPSSHTTSVYRPPQITPTLPPTSVKPQRKPRISHTLNEYVREELDDAPIAQPSIGAGSGLRGKEAAKEAERRNYEEERLLRLPGEGKKGRRKRDVGEGFGEDEILGGAGELGDLVKGAGKRRKIQGVEKKIGEAWEKRVKRGIGRKRR